MAGLKLCLLEEKAKTNASFHAVARTEVQRASDVVERFVEELLEANDRAVSQFRTCRVIPGEGEFCFITVDGKVRDMHVINKRQDRQRIR